MEAIRNCSMNLFKLGDNCIGDNRNKSKMVPENKPAVLQYKEPSSIPWVITGISGLCAAFLYIAGAKYAKYRSVRTRARQRVRRHKASSTTSCILSKGHSKWIHRLKSWIKLAESSSGILLIGVGSLNALHLKHPPSISVRATKTRTRNYQQNLRY